MITQNIESTKTCTKCGKELPICEFYTKGWRIDSQCKKCVCENKKSKYVNKQDEISFSALIKILQLIQELEINQITLAIKLLDEVIELCQNKIQQ
jgi:hypothetical protein